MSHSFFTNYGQYFILLCALVGLYYRNKLKTYNASYFPYFLLLVFIGEFVAYYLSKINKDDASSNIFIYFLLPVQILFYLWFVGNKILEKPTISFTLIGLFLLVFITEIVIGKEKPIEIFTRSFSLGGILLSLMFTLFILKLTKGEEVITFYRNLYFWICIGIAAYYTFSFPFYTYYNTLLNKHENVFYIYRSITNHLSLSMYLLFIIGFIWSKKI